MESSNNNENIAAGRQPPQQPPTAVGTPGAAVQQSVTAGCSDGLPGNDLGNNKGNGNGNINSSCSPIGETELTNKQSMIITTEPYESINN